MAARLEDWSGCRDLAQMMQGLELRDGDTVEALYALGYAEEMLGRLVEARIAYEAVLVMNRRHAKSQRRLQRLGE